MSLVLLASVALAATPGPPPSASVAVHVTLPRTAASADATVVLVEADASAARREVRLEQSPVAWFDGLIPATYDVSVEVDGATIARTRIRVDAREVVAVQAVVASAGAAESRIGVAHRYRDDHRTEFNARLLGDLPSGTSLWGLVETAAPFVINDTFDNGGLASVRPARMSRRGQSWTVTSMSMGDLEVRHPDGAGRFTIAPDLGAVEAVSITSDLAPVEVRTPGVHLALTPRMPTPRWRWTTRASVTTPGMVGVNAREGAPSVARMESWRAGGVTAGGPLASGAGVVVSASATDSRYRERESNVRPRTRAATLFAHLVARPGARHQLRMLTGVERLRFPFEGRRQFLGRALDTTARLGQMQVSWDHAGDDDSRYTLTAGVQRARFTPQVGLATPGGTVDRVTDGVVPGPARAEASWVWDLGARVDRPAWTVGPASHAFGAGVSVRRATVATSVLAAPVVAETVAGLPARIWQPVVPDVGSSRTVTDLAVFVNDRVTVGTRFTLSAGLRVDVSSGAARGAATGIRWTTLAPRVSFRWSPSPLSVFGGYGRYVAGNVQPLLRFGDPGEPSAEVYRWLDPDSDGVFDPGEAGTLVARAGRGQAVAAIDPGLRAPISQEWTIGAEHRVSALMTLRGAIIFGRQHDLVGSVNMGVPFSEYRAFDIPDAAADEYSPADDRPLTIYERLPSSYGRDRFLLTNPETARATYEGIEVSWELQTARWSMLFGAMAYRTRGWGGSPGPRATENDQLVIGDRFEDPNASSEPAGSFFFDRSYVGKWSGSYRAPGDVRLAFTARYQDGQPFSRVVVVPDLGTGPAMVQAYRVGRTRFTYTASVDVRVEKGFRMGSGRAAVHVDVFNVTNHRNELDEDIVTGPRFRESTIVQPPLTVRLGVRLEF